MVDPWHDMIHSGLFDRTHLLVGDTGIEKLQAAHVLLCGVGGVGSFAAEALGRAGIGRLTLIDHDIVAPSNLNRQLPATLETIGEKKIAVLGQRLASINPLCQLERIDQFLTSDNIPKILDHTHPHWVLDAIDSLNSKVSLIVESHTRGIPIACSMGAGGRLDPTRLMVGDLMDTTLCPLARAVRHRVRKRGLGRGIQAVWSLEPPHPPSPAEPTDQGRPRVINGTISYMPALFGLTLAGIIVQGILSSPIP
ncbi:MAG: tRNA threonylcarbamoyladenosine dehydratase [Magnetococcus sp. DMHC-6]